MIDKLLKLNDGSAVINASGVGDYTLDLKELTDAFGSASSGLEFSDGAFLNIVCPTVGTGTGTGSHSFAIELRTSATVEALTSGDYDSCPIHADLEGKSYTAGYVVYRGTIPIKLKRYVGLYFAKTGTATIYVDAWIGNPVA